ncbi:MAG: YkgJ family cysteine cluster protein, partial [Desulfotomaculales bacterium]
MAAAEKTRAAGAGGAAGASPGTKAAKKLSKFAGLARDFPGGRGYDLAVWDPGASVQDYLEALTGAIAALPLTRLSGKKQHCFGCDRCCAERAPLTSVDCLLLTEATGERNPGAFLQKYTVVSVDGPVVDIVLKLTGDGRCVFLDRKTKLCRVYAARPLVCRTYICSPASRRALTLRSAVVNRGEDELVRLWFKAGMVVHQARRPRPERPGCPRHPGACAGRYAGVPGEDVLP